MAKPNKSQNKNNFVAKELGPDVMALLEDVEASIQQIKSIEGGGEMGEETPPEMENENEEVEMAENVITDTGIDENEDEDENKTDIMKELKAIKGMLEKSSCTKSEDADSDDKEEVEKSSTARDSADDRLLEETMVNDENWPVKKALNALLAVTKSLQPKKVVKKPVDVQSQVAKALTPVVQALTPLVDTVAAQGKALENILSELGYAKAIEDAIKVEKSQDKQKPVRATDTEVIKELFTELLNVAKNNNSGSGNSVNKALAEERSATEIRRQNLYDAMKHYLPKLDKLDKAAE